MTKEEVVDLANSFTLHRSEDAGLVDGELELILAYIRGEVRNTGCVKALQTLHKRSSVTLQSRFMKVVFEAYKKGRLTVN